MFVRALLIVGIAILVWSALARSSTAHGTKEVVTVRPYETLWTIAEHHYAGDLREAIWEIERANHLRSADVRVGQRLILP
jgi:LysM domain